MTHSEFKPEAVITLSNWGGVEIMLNRSNDGVYYRFNYGQDIEKEEIFEADILHSEEKDREGEAYFIHNRNSDPYSVYYLSEAIKLNH